MAGLAIIPLLPYVDHPIEKFIDKRFDAFWPPAAREGSASSGSTEQKNGGDDEEKEKRKAVDAGKTKHD